MIYTFASEYNSKRWEFSFHRYADDTQIYQDHHTGWDSQFLYISP